ncbi:response regulator transcription factor [Sandaracinobacteroides saxicola]|uniref:Response regulator transcription factor n=1 Tax=Sandaracinobacteroides saxicola TaxID=2759707 RepID=A0A7G5ILB4_9SPHN|nr:response regulator transcription factor [Sandaracinobacteroides saxicola]QMW24156.1 response regulator transcription factor [Sandaracinobacteroides saxicola]
MRILIADDHALMRSALAGAVRMVDPDADITTVGSFPEACRAAPGHALILCDLIMPGADPLGGIAALRAAAADTPILVITGHEDDATLLSLLALGIAGFVPKSVSGQVMEAAIRLVLAGGTYLPPRLAILAASRTDPPTRPPPRFHLSARQREVLAGIARGHSTKQIAAALAIAPATVKAHTAALLAEIGASNRAQAVALARDAGLI